LATHLKGAGPFFHTGKGGKCASVVLGTDDKTCLTLKFSPIDPTQQGELNLSFASSGALRGSLLALLKAKQVVMSPALSYPPGIALEKFQTNLARSQYRYDMERYLGDPFTPLYYPVFDSFAENRKIGGALVSNLYWKLLFTSILPETAFGYICILENSYNQTLAYPLDGPDASFVGWEDIHDTRYNHLEEFADINAFSKSRAGPETLSFTGVPLNHEFGKYKLRIYPSSDTEDHFSTNKPWIYTVLVACTFIFTSSVFVMFAYVVERRQRIVMDRVVDSAGKSAAAERELNEFLSHEVRNPLSAAMAAHSFVSSGIRDSANLLDDERKSLQEDAKIVDSSLLFIDEFLRSMLDMSRASANKLEVKMAPTDLLKDIWEPVCSILYQRDGNVDVTMDCPKNLIVATDCLRLKQIMLNLGRNSTKFVRSGFIRFRVAIVDGLVVLYVEDSGPGIPIEKRGALFEKFQTSLDVLSQGTGVGLSLCEHMAYLLKGKVSLDESYDSGIEGSPGARFVIELNTPPLPTQDILKSIASNDPNISGETDDADESFPELVELPETFSVLFVDDDVVLRKLFMRSVQKVAPMWEIHEASNGETALRLVDSASFDLIFMDQYVLLCLECCGKELVIASLTHFESCFLHFLLAQIHG
jgi:nitrogen-specific signal transduction histidine kinase